MPSSHDAQESPKNQHILFSALLCLLTFVSYAQTFSCAFIESYDDEMYVTLNPFVSQGFTFQGFLWSLSSFVSGNWHPVTWWSHMLDVSMFGMNPAGHHAVSLVIHTINAVLLYAFLFRVTGLRARSFVVAALFSLHPLHVESVAWVAERKDVLSSLFALAALHAYVSYTQSERKVYYLAVVFLLCLGLMSKPMLVTLPFLLLLLDYWPIERVRHLPLSRLVMEKLPLVLPVVALSIVTLVAQRSAGALVPLEQDSVAMRLSNALDAYAVYLRKFIAPYDLASFYPYTAVSSIRVIVSLTTLAVISGVVWRLHKKRPWLLTGWVWYLGMLVPVIGLVRVGEQAYADRYMYLPITGVLIMVVWGMSEFLEKVTSKRVFKTVVSTGAIVACALVTWNQTGYWRDSYSLYARELAVTKGNWHAHFGLGNVYAGRQDYQEAVRHYYAVLETRPLSLDTHNNLGSSLRSLGRRPEAINHFLRATEINPGYTLAHFNLGLTLGEMGNREAARSFLQQALAIDPEFQEARDYLDYLNSYQGAGGLGSTGTD